MDVITHGPTVTPATPIAWSKKSILFSACQEDTRSELAAFGSIENKRVFCVTAGGGRVLNLLVGRPAAITTVDLNPAQNALLELKMAAIRELDHSGYLEFLGVRSADDRLATYQRRLRVLLSPDARAFFDRSQKAVAAGILFQGNMEKYLRIAARVLKLGHPFGLRNLLEARDLTEQRIAMTRWETPFWRRIAHLVGHKRVLTALSGDPGFYRNLPDEPPLHEVLYDRVHRHLKHNLLRENTFLQLVLYGRYVYEEFLPPYLHADTFERIKSALGSVDMEIRTAMVTDVLEASGGYDAFSISDICSYLDPGPHYRLFDTVFRAANRGARLCSRSNIFHRPLSPEHAAMLERDQALEERLSLHDHATVHEFVVGAIH